MFQWLLRAHAITVASLAVRPMLTEVTAALSRAGHPKSSSDLWEDSYFLGYFGGLITAVAQHSTRGRLTANNGQYALRRTFIDLLGPVGESIALRCVNRHRDPDFLLGLEHALKAGGCCSRRAGFENDHDVVKVRAAAAGIVSSQIFGRDPGAIMLARQIGFMIVTSNEGPSV